MVQRNSNIKFISQYILRIFIDPNQFEIMQSRLAALHLSLFLAVKFYLSEEFKTGVLFAGKKTVEARHVISQMHPKFLIRTPVVYLHYDGFQLVAYFYISSPSTHPYTFPNIKFRVLENRSYRYNIPNNVIVVLIKTE